jgi:hypothetical protein
MGSYGRYLLVACVIAPWLTGAAQAQTPSQTPQPAPADMAQNASSRPNSLVIWGDDIGTAR